MFWMNSFAYLILIFFYFECFCFIKLSMSSLHFSTTDFLNLSKLSTWEVFENPKPDTIFSWAMIEWSKMYKWIITKLGLKPLVTVSITIEAQITFWDNPFRKCLWYPTKVTYLVRDFQFWFMKWSMYWCQFWTSIDSYACICVMPDMFWPNSWIKWSRWTIISLHKYNITSLSF